MQDNISIQKPTELFDLSERSCLIVHATERATIMSTA